jgi:hypothetical protein
MLSGRQAKPETARIILHAPCGIKTEFSALEMPVFPWFPASRLPSVQASQQPLFFPVAVRAGLWQNTPQWTIAPS